MSDVTVIIVNYNAGRLLAACVKSVLTSTLPVQVYVIDNASRDDSLQLLREHCEHDSRLQITINSENVGFARAANQVLPQIHSEYLLFLNPDCLIANDTLAEFVAVLTQYPQAGMAGALVRNLDGTEQAGCRRSVPSPWRSIVRVLHLDKLLPKHPKFRSFVLKDMPMPEHPVEIEGISGACMFVRQAALQAVGPMDEHYFLHCEDLDWFMRFRQQGWKIMFVPSIEVTHAKGACSQAEPLRVLWYKHRGMVRFYRKFFRYQYPIFVFWGVVIAVWIRFTILAIATGLMRLVMR